MVIQLAQLDGNIMMFQEKFSLKGEERRTGRAEQTRQRRGEWPREVLASQLRHFAPFCGENDRQRGERRERRILVKTLLNPAG